MKKVIWILASVLVAALIIYGLWLDNQNQLSQTVIETAFYSASIIGLLPISLFFMLKQQILWQNILHVLLAFIIWRISFFPIMVLAGFAATWGESMTILLFNKPIVYPFLLLAMAGMNALALWIAETVFALFRQSAPQSTSYWSLASVLMIALPLGILAIMISFTKPMDWHTIPDTSFIDDKPLPEASLPEMNPYDIALEDESLSIQHKILFKAAEITYDWIPDNTEWSQVVKGVLEKEFVTTTNVSTSFCSKIHYRAFITAQPFIKQQSIQELDF